VFLLSENDIALAAAALLPGSAGVIVVVEDRWTQALSSAAQRGGLMSLDESSTGGARLPTRDPTQAPVDASVHSYCWSRAGRRLPTRAGVGLNHPGAD
jgi:hypothetical protein